MAINNSCVVTLVGSGATSCLSYRASLTANNIGNYILAYPIGLEVSLDIFGHNCLLSILNTGVKPCDALTSIMEVKSASYCNRDKAEIAYINTLADNIGNIKDPYIRDYIDIVKYRTGAEHSIGNIAIKFSNDQSKLLPNQIPDYVSTNSSNFTKLMENDMAANLAIRNLDPSANSNLNYITGLGTLTISYNKSKLDILLRNHKNKILLANADIFNAFNELTQELQRLDSIYQSDSNSFTIDQQNGLISLYNQLHSNNTDKDIRTIWAQLLLNVTFPLESFATLNQKIDNYNLFFVNFINIKDQNVQFDSNSLLYIYLTPTTGNTRGLKVFWSSFLESLSSLYFVFTNDIADPNDNTFEPLVTRFVDPDDLQLKSLKNNMPGKLLIVSIPSDANVVFAASRKESTPDIVKHPVSGQDVEIFPQF